MDKNASFIQLLDATEKQSWNLVHSYKFNFSLYKLIQEYSSSVCIWK